MIENHRCPWCGSDFTSDNNEIDIKINFNLLERRCPTCGKPYASRGSIINVLFVILLFSFYVYFNNIKFVSNIVLLIGSILVNFAYLRMPLERIANGKWYDRVEADNYIGTAQITWLQYKEGGLVLAKYRIPNNFIVPICFYNEHNLPLTNVICVRLEKYRKGGQKNYKIYVLRKEFLEEISGELKNFYLYNKRVPVGKGVFELSPGRQND